MDAVQTKAKVEGEGNEEGEGAVKRDPTSGFEFTCGVLSVDEADGRVLAVVGRCRLKPLFASTEYDVLLFGSLTQCPCVILIQCELTRCYSTEGACFQRLTLKCCELLSIFDFKFNLRRYSVAPAVGLREFAFDAVFGDRAEQAGVYERSARPLVADFINGFNGRVAASPSAWSVSRK